MAKKRRVMLFLVEGKSEREALEILISNIIKNDLVVFQVMEGDITSDINSTPQNIKKLINQKIEEYRAESKVKKTDIMSVIHLMDIDGAYINNEKFMIENNEIEKGFKYYPDGIYAQNKQKIKNRNSRKSSVMNLLSTTNQISTINYRAYYFCCNLDHVLYDEANLESILKVDYAYDFQDKYLDNEIGFINFMLKSDFAVNGEYKDTWNFLKEELNSLGRYSNFHLFFSDFGEYIKDEYRDVLSVSYTHLFLGLGVQAPTPEWGAMLSEAKNVMATNPNQELSFDLD